jgi:hypothetical protein
MEYYVHFRVMHRGIFSATHVYGKFTKICGGRWSATLSNGCYDLHLENFLSMYFNLSLKLINVSLYQKTLFYLGSQNFGRNRLQKFIILRALVVRIL